MLRRCEDATGRLAARKPRAGTARRRFRTWKKRSCQSNLKVKLSKWRGIASGRMWMRRMWVKRNGILHDNRRILGMGLPWRLWGKCQKTTGYPWRRGGIPRRRAHPRRRSERMWIKWVDPRHPLGSRYRCQDLRPSLLSCPLLPSFDRDCALTEGPIIDRGCYDGMTYDQIHELCERRGYSREDSEEVSKTRLASTCAEERTRCFRGQCYGYLGNRYRGKRPGNCRCGAERKRIPWKLGEPISRGWSSLDLCCG